MYNEIVGAPFKLCMDKNINGRTVRINNKRNIYKAGEMHTLEATKKKHNELLVMAMF